MADEIAVIGDEEKKKGGKGKLIGMIGGGVVVLVAVYFLFLSGGGGDEEAGPTTTTIPADGPVIEVDEMTITLAEDPVRYARLKFGVVLPEGGNSAAVGERVPVLKDAVLDVMAGYTVDDLMGPEAISSLREQLTEQALVVFPDGEVLRVVITEVLVQ